MCHVAETGVAQSHPISGDALSVQTTSGHVDRVPETRYATTTDGLHIGYQVEGTGPLNVIELTNGTNFSVGAAAEQPRWQAYVDRLSSFSRLIRFDLRGIALSDPLASADPPTLEQWATDALAVLDDHEIENAAILAVLFAQKVLGRDPRGWSSHTTRSCSRPAGRNDRSAELGA